jgi:hypothetical protein
MFPLFGFGNANYQVYFDKLDFAAAQKNIAPRYSPEGDAGT